MKYHRAAFILFISGIFLIGASAVFGKGGIMLFFFIPVFYGTGILAFLGMLCIVVSMFLMFYSMTSIFEYRKEDVAESAEEKKMEGGGIVFIGPVPIIFGSDVKTAVILMILASALMIGMFLFLIIMFR